jgi:hypothetical protein
MPSAFGWGGFRRIEFGDALPGPLPVGEGEHWATIACRVTVRGPRWAFPPRLPGGPTAAGPFCDELLRSGDVSALTQRLPVIERNLQVIGDFTDGSSETERDRSCRRVFRLPC